MAHQQHVDDIDRLLRVLPDKPEQIAEELKSKPELSRAADWSGYTLLHAASSYGHIGLVRSLVETYKVDVNIKDQNGDTPLHYAETVKSAETLLSLGADLAAENEDSLTPYDNAEENIDDGGEWPEVANLLRRRGNLDNAESTSHNPRRGTDGNDSHHPPPPLPPNVTINMQAVPEDEGPGEEPPDPEFRRRIEQLATRDDFQGETGQNELKELISEALQGLSSGSSRDVRRRTG